MNEYRAGYLLVYSVGEWEMERLEKHIRDKIRKRDLQQINSLCHQMAGI